MSTHLCVTVVQPTDALTLNRYVDCGANLLSYVDVMGFGFMDSSVNAVLDPMSTFFANGFDSLRELVDYEGDNIQLQGVSGRVLGLLDGIQSEVEFMLPAILRLITEFAYRGTCWKNNYGVGVYEYINK